MGEYAPPAGPTEICGLVLAGGEGRRMGGADKGLLLLDGRPLAAHVLARLAPQAGTLRISANRHADRYAAFGAPVLTDPLPGHQGPLAGLLAGLQDCPCDWLLCAPCDSPLLPADLGERLSQGLRQADGRAALALVRGPDAESPEARTRLHPTFALLHRSLAAPLAAALERGERRVAQWMCSQPHAEVLFDRPGDQHCFANANTPGQLHGLLDLLDRPARD